MSTEALDLLGRKLGVGDHVVWGVKSGIRHGFVKSIELVTSRWNPHGSWMVSASISPDCMGTGVRRHAACFCAIVLPGIQDPEVQLAD